MLIKKNNQCRSLLLLPGHVPLRGGFRLLEEICLVEAFILLPFLEVLLDDFHLAEAVDLELLEVFELEVDEFEDLALDVFLVLGPDELAVVGEVFALEDHQQQLEEFVADLETDVGGHDVEGLSFLILDDLVADVVELLEAIEDVLGILDEVVLEVLLLHLIVGLGHAADELGGEALVLGLEAVLLHLLEALLGLVVLLLQALVVLLHVHLGLERLLEGVELDDVVDLDVARGEVEHVEDRDAVGVQEGAVRQHLVVRLPVVLEDVAQLPELELAVAVEQEVVGGLGCVRVALQWYWLSSSSLCLKPSRWLSTAGLVISLLDRSKSFSSGSPLISSKNSTSFRSSNSGVSISLTCLKVSGISFSSLILSRFSSSEMISPCLNLRSRSSFFTRSWVFWLWPVLECLWLKRTEVSGSQLTRSCWNLYSLSLEMIFLQMDLENSALSSCPRFRSSFSSSYRFCSPRMASFSMNFSGFSRFLKRCWMLKGYSVGKLVPRDELAFLILIQI